MEWFRYSTPFVKAWASRLANTESLIKAMKRVKKRNKAQREALEKIIQFTIADLREALDEVGNEDPNFRH